MVETARGQEFEVEMVKLQKGQDHEMVSLGHHSLVKCIYDLDPVVNLEKMICLEGFKCNVNGISGTISWYRPVCSLALST